MRAAKAPPKPSGCRAEPFATDLAERLRFRPLPGVGARYDRFSDQGQTTQGFTLPLSYTFRSDIDPRRQLSISLPITLADVDGARAYMGTLNTSLRLPVTRDWALTGSVGYSQVRATDLGTAGQIGSIAITMPASNGSAQSPTSCTDKPT